MQTAVNKTKNMFKRHMNRAPWAIEKVPETFLREKRKGKIKVLSKKDTKKVLEVTTCNSNRFDFL